MNGTAAIRDIVEHGVDRGFRLQAKDYSTSHTQNLEIICTKKNQSWIY